MQDTQGTKRSPSHYSSWRSAGVPKDTQDTQRSCCPENGVPARDRRPQPARPETRYEATAERSEA